MPVTKSNLQADYANNGNPADGISASGSLCYLNDTITFVGDESANDEITLLDNLPKGALVDPAKSAIIGAAASGVSLHIGSSTDDEGYGSSVSIASAGTRPFDANGVALIPVDASGGLRATVAAGSPGAGSQRVSIAYYVR
tara:strand:- start:2625 stop:3047 length:423 start_codon:yes stop_codon:yes gene_type:complete